MKQNNSKKISAPKPLSKKKVSSGVFSVEKNLKSETLVIAKEQSDRSNLRDASGLLRFARNDKGTSGNNKGVMGRKFGFRISNFKSWHKTFAAEKARSVEYLSHLRYN